LERFGIADQKTPAEPLEVSGVSRHERLGIADRVRLRIPDSAHERRGKIGLEFVQSRRVEYFIRHVEIAMATLRVLHFLVAHGLGAKNLDPANRAQELARASLCRQCLMFGDTTLDQRRV
jgi:hypothetical protein